MYARRAWTGTKLLYFFIRYVPLLVHMCVSKPSLYYCYRRPCSSLTVVGTELSPAFHFTAHDCFIWQVFQGVAAALIMWAVDIVLILRGEKKVPIDDCHLTLSSHCSFGALLWKQSYTGPRWDLLCLGSFRHDHRTYPDASQDRLRRALSCRIYTCE